jgi:tetratricopeptide (TPR) repeat protein
MFAISSGHSGQLDEDNYLVIAADSSPPMTIGDNASLSLQSIASALRRGSALDEDITQTHPMAQTSQNMTSLLPEMSIADTMDLTSDQSLKRKSETLQTVGNRLANSGLYVEAIRYYSKAIALYDEDYRLYCNRSFCYERLMKFEDSLADALRSVILMPTRPKPYFRQGKALIGLKRYTDAEKAFHKILQMNGKCEDTAKELLKTRYLALRDNGMDVEAASLAAISHDTIDEAIKASADNRMITIGSDGSPKTSTMNDTNSGDDMNAAIGGHKSGANFQDNERRFRKHWTPTDKQFLPFNQRFHDNRQHYRRSQSRPPGARVSQTSYGNNSATVTSYLPKRSHSVDNINRVKRSEQPTLPVDNFSAKRFKGTGADTQNRLPKNLFGYKGLWIGNVSPDCKPALLRQIFMRYGPLDYVNVVPQSYCAFVNYHNHQSPRVAIAALYGQTVTGVSNGFRPLVFRFIPSNDQKDLHYMRPYQPRGTNECYFWRTTGCRDFNCPLLHYPVCRGIDFQPWMHKKCHKKC